MMEWSYPVDYGDELVKDLLSQFNNSTPMGDPQVPDGQPQPTQVPHETQPETFQQAQFDATRNMQSRSYDTQPGGDEGAQSECFQPMQPEGQLQNALQLSATSEQAQQPEIRLVAVEVPKLENSEEYEYLPGHFDVRYIINEKWDEEGEAMYTVRLRSGELQTVSPIQLQLLNKGPVAFEHFRVYGPEEESEEQSGSSDAVYDPSSYPNVRRSRRATRSRRQITDFFSVKSSDDDIARSASISSDDVVGTSGATSRARRLRRRPRQKSSSQSTRQTSMASDSEDYKSKGTRHSTRRRTTFRRNLRERFEDDISENELDTGEKKFFGAKETFKSVSSNDPFRLRHLNTCGVCAISGNDQVKGPLVFCQGCTFAYHQACLGPRATRDHLVTKVADENFILQCRHCLGVAHNKDPLCPHEGNCNICKEKGSMSKPLRARLTPKQEQQLRNDNGGKDPITPVDMARVNNVDNLLFRCVGCRRVYHFEHLPPLSEDGSDVVTSLFEQYLENWRCLDCLSTPGEIGAMVAWRPVDPQTSNNVASETAEENKEYLIKWKNMSYHRTTWMSGSWVRGVTQSAMRRAFLRSDKDIRPQSSTEEAIPEDFLRVDIVFDVKFSEQPRNRTEADDLARVDKVIEAYVKFKGLPYEESVWEAPPELGSERWGDFKSAYDDWVRRDYIHTPSQDALKKHLAHVRKQNFKLAIVQDTQPNTMTGGNIMEFQKDGLNWLYYMWFKQQNAILADEMGLGKTIQVIGFFATLVQYHKCWPLLVVAPNPTCPNWRKEIKKWVPSIRVVMYYGTACSRKLAQEHEMFNKGSNDLGCHVVVTSYEAMVDENSRKILSKIPWAGLVVDEGQRLKNDRSQMYEGLSRIKFPFKVLLTGTPLQNNVRELFNLLQFCDPTINAESLEVEYGVLSKDNIPALHEMIRPFFLRRTKAQVLNFLPPISNIIVPVSMSVVQKKLYKSILAKNPQLIQAIFRRNGAHNSLKQPERKNLNNILLQLRKCLCHPFCYSKAIEERTSDSVASHRHLVEAAGKLQLLQLMLPKLQQRGHRVLIFSQFLENLDIVEDFLSGMGILHRRLDGRMNSLEKQKQIDDFNAEGSPYFVFLLSTRSGGVGINLATADTVIIMDPDFNPHQDIQASSRAHRIGQKNNVLVFQLMTRGSAEEKIMQIGKKKMVLDHVLIDRMISEEVDGRDLESILRHGAQALFEGDDSEDIHYDSESVDKLLDRSQVEQVRTPDQNGNEDPFSFARVWANDNQNLDGQLGDVDEGPINSSVWENILKERELAAAEENKEKDDAFGRGKRKRMTVDYTHASDLSPVKPHHRDSDGDNDAEFKRDDVEDSDSDSDPGMASDEMVRPVKKAKVAPFRRVNLPDIEPSPPPGPAPEPQHTLVCLACNKGHPPGQCRLKLAGVEHCGLCGLVHYGSQRTCPHLRSETQVARMLEALKHSTEDRLLRDRARSYIGGIKGDLTRRRKLQELRRLQKFQDGTPSLDSIPTTAAAGYPVNGSGSPVIDLTAYNGSVSNKFPVRSQFSNPSSVPLNGHSPSYYGHEH